LRIHVGPLTFFRLAMPVGPLQIDLQGPRSVKARRPGAAWPNPTGNHPRVGAVIFSHYWPERVSNWGRSGEGDRQLGQAVDTGDASQTSSRRRAPCPSGGLSAKASPPAARAVPGSPAKGSSARRLRTAGRAHGAVGGSLSVPVAPARAASSAMSRLPLTADTAIVPPGRSRRDASPPRSDPRGNGVMGVVFTLLDRTLGQRWVLLQQRPLSVCFDESA